MILIILIYVILVHIIRYITFSTIVYHYLFIYNSFKAKYIVLILKHIVMNTYKIINIFTDEIIGYFNSDKTYNEIYDNLDFYNTLSMYFYCDLDDITIEKTRKRDTGLLINNML